ARANRDGRHAWRRAERFLRAAENDVEPFLINIQGNGGERGDGVHDKERAEFVRDFTEAGETGDDAGGSFALREANDFDFAAACGTAHVFWINRAAERRFHFCDLCLRATRDFVHALGKIAIDANYGFIARLERIHDGGFDAARTGGGHRHGDAVLRLE